MSEQNSYRNLTQREIDTLLAQGCVAEDWRKVQVTEPFDPACIRNTRFLGSVKIGRLTGSIKTTQGLEKPCGIYNAIISVCTIADGTRMANIGMLANYDIGTGVCIENVAKMEVSNGAAFGNGVEVKVLNEAGGREVILFDELSAQFAYLMCLHCYRPELIKKLAAIAKDYAARVRSDHGTIGPGARICSTVEIIDVNVGPAAVINGAASLVNGTVLSSAEAPTIVGLNIIAEDFIIAESASVTDAADLKKVFVGQGCQVGKQISARNSLFFANCEAFYGEVCSVFAGPYTVTHHKSTLLIAGLFSFFNAGSGTNQSNHMYKLGPVHEGKLERGTKTGSFSYMMWPCKVGPFSIVLGKHTRIFNTSDFPFSQLTAKPDGKCSMVPGLNLVTVGIIRDGAKWPSRDRRKGTKKRDIISFDVFSPYTVGKMIKASSILKNLQDNTDRSLDEVVVNGTQIKRVLLRMGQKFYRTGIEMYLLEKMLQRAEKALDGGIEKLRAVFATDPAAVYSRDWVDIGGQLMPRQRLLDVIVAVESAQIADIETFNCEFEKINRVYSRDEWVWIKTAYKEVFNVNLDIVTKEELLQAADSCLKVKTKFLKQVLMDAEKEFTELSRTGFGQDGRPEDAEEDFCRIRGKFPENEFVRQIQNSIETIRCRVTEFKGKVENLM